MEFVFQWYEFRFYVAYEIICINVLKDEYWKLNLFIESSIDNILWIDNIVIITVYE